MSKAGERLVAAAKEARQIAADDAHRMRLELALFGEAHAERPRDMEAIADAAWRLRKAHDAIVKAVRSNAAPTFGSLTR